MTWRAKKSDTSNGGYSQSLLESLFSRYGPLHHVLVSEKRNGKALVSFHSSLDAVRAHPHTHTPPPPPPPTHPHARTHTMCDLSLTCSLQQKAVERETGMPACPLTLSWVCGEPPSRQSGLHDSVKGGVQGGDGGGAGVKEGAGDSVRWGGDDGVRKDGGDYESIVLMKLRQAEERKRLCENLASTDS